MASRPRITAARVLAGIACAMLLPAASQASAPAHRAFHLSSHRAIRAVRHGAVPGEVIVRFRPHVAAHRRAHLARSAGVHLSQWLGTRGLWLVHVRPGHTATHAISALERSPGVRWAERNHYVSLNATTPDDPLFAQDWGLHNTEQVVQSLTGTGRTPTSTRRRRGIRRQGRATWSSRSSTPASTTHHDDLAANIWTNPGETGGGKERTAWTTTGTATSTTGTAGTSASTRQRPDGRRSGTGRTSRARSAPPETTATGVTGVNWNVQIMPLRVPRRGGNLADAAIAAAFAYAGSMGARVVNASLGGAYTSPADASPRSTATPNTLFVVVGRQRRT